MSRTFESDNLVQLPRLDAQTAQAVGSAVLAAAANKTLPAPVAEALAELRVAIEALQATAMQSIPTADTPAARAADADLDDAWSVLHGLLRALSRMPDQPRAEQAAALLGDLFPNGLRFTRLRFQAEWTESENRLKMIDERGFASQIEQLGGAPALAQLRQAHAHYGEVLAIVAARTPAPGVGIREARDAVMTALRQYVVGVTATLRGPDPTSVALARELLAPIETWEPAVATKAPPAQPPTVPPAPVAADRKPESTH